MVRAAVDALAPPDPPLVEPWGVSLAEIVNRSTSRRVPGQDLLLKQADRFGALRLDLRSITIDASEAKWDAVTAIRLQQLGEGMVHNVVERELLRALKLPIPGKRLAANKVGLLADHITGIMLESFAHKVGDSPLVRPTMGAVEYRSLLKRKQTLAVGGVATGLFLLYPGATDLVLGVARERGIAITG